MGEPQTVTLKYRAFISYSHVDTNWAKWLHRGLERFRIDKDLVGRETATGPIPDALRPIFRDRDDFTAGHALTEQTLAALDASAALIVICSPSAIESHYVNEEICSFKSRHPERSVIPLIVHGKPDDAVLECFPPALKFKLDAKGRATKRRAELLAADAREEGDGKDLALAKVIAGLLGLSSDDVFRRAERERRATARRRHVVQALFGVLAVLLIIGGVGWWKQDVLREQFYWRWIMRPNALSLTQERGLQPNNEFKECAYGCPTMVVIPPGKFTMGSSYEKEYTERPEHEVAISKPFAIGKFEVTFEQWDACVAAGGCPMASDSGFGRGLRPVINVSWEDAQQYVTWLANRTGKPYRLPTEAEWEYAAWAGSKILGVDVGNYAWFQHNSGSFTQPVGQRKVNAFGLYDVYGNVWEWVRDWYHSDYIGAPSDGSAWITPSAENWLYPRPLFVYRGGGWNDTRDALKQDRRRADPPAYHNNDLGFRVARTLDQ